MTTTEANVLTMNIIVAFLEIAQTNPRLIPQRYSQLSVEVVSCKV
jgi:hypothetical protein